MKLEIKLRGREFVNKQTGRVVARIVGHRSQYAVIWEDGTREGRWSYFRDAVQDVRYFINERYREAMKTVRAVAIETQTGIVYAGF